MWADSVLEEVRKIRASQAAAFAFDVRAVVADLRRREGADGRAVLLPPAQIPAAPVRRPANGVRPLGD